MEGALLKLIAFSALQNQKINLAMAQAVLAEHQVVTWPTEQSVVAVATFDPVVSGVAVEPGGQADAAGRLDVVVTGLMGSLTTGDVHQTMDQREEALADCMAQRPRRLRFIDGAIRKVWPKSEASVWIGIVGASAIIALTIWEAAVSH